MSEELRCPDCNTELMAHESRECLNAWAAKAVMQWWNYRGIWNAGQEGEMGKGTGFISDPVTDTAFQYALGGREYGEYTPKKTYDADARRCIWSPSTNISAAFLLEEKIAERGLTAVYGDSLEDAINHGEFRFAGDLEFAIAHASPLQRTRAAIAACQKGESR